MFDLRDVDRIDEETDHDRRRRQQDVVDEARRGCQPAAAAEFGEIGAGQHADRRADQGGHCRHHQAADDRIEQATIAAGRRRVQREQARAQRVESLVKQRDQYPRQPEQAERQRQAGNKQQHRVDNAAAPVDRIVGRDRARHHFLLGLLAFAEGKPHQHQLRQREYDGRDQEQDQTQLDQRRRVQVPDRFREFVGERRGDAVAGRQQ